MKKQVSDMRSMALTLVNLKGWRNQIVESYLGTVKFALCAGPRADEGRGGGSNAAHFHNTFSY